MKKLIIILVVLFLLFTSCDTTNPKPPEENPLGYQEDIPWPSLADSPWPMFRGNAQGTNRSKYEGPQLGVIEWINNDLKTTTGLCLGYNNEVYAAAFYPSGIYKINGNTGETMWIYDSVGNGFDMDPCPLVLKDSTIIATTGSNGRLLAIRNDGKLKWNFQTEGSIWNRGMVVTRGGEIIFVDSDKNLYALGINGELLWEFHGTLFATGAFAALTLSPLENTVYLPSTNSSIVAFDLDNKTIKWIFGDEILSGYTTIDNEGNIYILENINSINNKHSLYSIKMDGSIRWIYEHNNPLITDNNSPISINSTGDSYFAYDTLYCVDYSGKLKFKKNIDSAVVPTAILIDKSDKLYLLELNTTGNTNARCLDKNGSEIWNIVNQIKYWPGYAGCITSNGQWIFPSYQYHEQIVSIK